MNKNYSPGLHLLLTLKVDDTSLLTSLNNFIDFSEKIIDNEGLEIVGVTSHHFDTDGYTVAICLMESDIYLCNYLKDNSDKVKNIGRLYKNYFNAEVLNETIVNR